MKLIDKDKITAEIEKRLSLLEGGTGHPEVVKRVEGVIKGYKSILSFIDTLEVKEIHEDIDVDLNPLFEELGVDPDSRFASMFKESFYKGIDRYLNKKENKL